MTKISFLHGSDVVGVNPILKMPRGFLSKKIPQKRFLNYSALTEGELNLLLIDEELGILEGYYQDPIGIYNVGRKMLADALFNGLHTSSKVGNFTGFIPKELEGVAASIKSAKKLFNAAGQVIDKSQRHNISMGIDPFNIPLVNCGSQPSPFQNNFQENIQTYIECLRQNDLVRILNNDLEKSSHHLLYEFLTENLNTVPQIVAIKANQHSGVFTMLNKISKVSKSNLRQWVKNGVMRENARQGIEPFTPTVTISALQSENDQPGIQGPFLQVLPGILRAITAAIINIAGLISGAKAKAKANEQALFTQLNSIGTRQGSPDNKDWYLGQNSGGSGNENTVTKTDNTPIILLAAAGLLLTR